MGIFSSKKKKDDVEKAAPAKKAKTVSAPAKLPVVSGVADVLLRPRITEKAANMTAVNVYTFDVRTSATKKEIADAIKKLYKVTPKKVRVVNTPPKKVTLRRRRGHGMTAATRKAYVYLKKGEQIQFA